MGIVDVVYEVWGDNIDCGTKCSAVVKSPVSVNDIKDKFAFEGDYLFRVKVLGSAIGIRCEHVWMDLLDVENDDVYLNLASQSELIEVRALMINNPVVEDHVLDSQHFEYMSEIEKRLNELQTFKDKNAVHPTESKAINSNSISEDSKNFFQNVVKTANQGMHSVVQSTVQLSNHENVKEGLQTVSKGMFGLWNSVKTVANTAATLVSNVTLGSTASVPSALAEEQLNILNNNLNTVYNPSLSDHIHILNDLWCATFNAVNNGTVPIFEKDSIKWKEILGFQSIIPANDLKTSGLLALKGMSFMISHYRSASSIIINKNKQNIKTNYPFSAVGVNITLLLSDVLGLRSRNYVTNATNYWEIFENPSSYYEVRVPLCVNSLIYI